jgi:hypothetical protein
LTSFILSPLFWIPKSIFDALMRNLKKKYKCRQVIKDQRDELWACEKFRDQLSHITPAFFRSGLVRSLDVAE